MREQKPLNEKEQEREYFRYLGIASTVGIDFVVSTFVGFAIGYWLLDNFFNTFPWFTIIFLILSIAAAFKHLFKIASRAGNNNETDEKNK